jgi:hypothetical protein
MCKALKIARSTLYHKSKPKVEDTALENAVIKEFRLSRGNYGTPKLKIKPYTFLFVYRHENMRDEQRRRNHGNSFSGGA